MAGLVVRSAVRNAVGDVRVAGNFFEALDKHVADVLKTAANRAKENGRATCRPCDL